MRRLIVTAGVLGFALAALPGAVAAAPLTCPTTTDSYDRFYTVDPATACVFGTGKINNAGEDDFLDGSGITGGFNQGAILDGESSGTAAGWVGIDYSFDDDPNDPQGDNTWTIPGFDPVNFDYLVAIKDGEQNPAWSVFLVTAGSGTWSTSPPDAWSHGVLYRRDDVTPGEEPLVPEPATLTLLGLALLAGGARARQRRRSEL